MVSGDGVFAGGRVRAVFFDAGETLHHLTTSRAELLIAVMTEAGLALSPTARRALQMRESSAINQFWDGCNLLYPDDVFGQRYLVGECSILLERLGVRARPEQVEAIAQGIVRPSWRRFFPETLPVLTALRPRFRLGIISNAGSYLAQVYEELGMQRHVDFMITSGEVGVEKPDPAIFALALERAGVQPEETIHVGDNPVTDVMGARAAGITPVLLDGSASISCPDGCCQVSSLSQLLPLLGVTSLRLK